MTVTQILYELKNAAILGPDGPLLRELSFRIRAGAVTVLLGPGGTGKSTLLSVLAGARLSPELVLEGDWSFRGGAIPGPALSPVGNIAWVRQRARATDAPPSGAIVYADALQAIAAHPSVLLVDEPSAGLDAAARDGMVRALREQAARGGVVLVTHDLAFAHAVADDAILLCARRLRGAGALAELLRDPPNELVARFLRDGSAWPSPAAPAHFRWIDEGKLAGMGRPGLLAPIEDDLGGIASAGVTHIVTLIEEALPPALLKPYGLSARHFPIPDMGVPAMGPCASLCREIERAIDGGECVAVHCHAGLGRTGTILAAYLAWRGVPVAEAIDRVRRVRSGYLQTQSQVEFVHRFADTHGA